MENSYLKDNFNHNPNIGPSVADFRRFLMKCNPRPNFIHYILACGTVIRGDVVNNIRSEHINNSHLDSFNKMSKLPAVGDDTCLKLFALLSENKSDSLLETAAIWADEKIWIVHMINQKHGHSILNLAPGKTLEEACPYAIEAYKADNAIPIMAAIIVPREHDNEIHYDIIWPYGRPDTYHW
jgi:hypothetical protein